VEELVNLLDVNATVLAAGGAGLPESIRGRPLQQLAGSDAADWPEEVFVQISESQTGRALRTKRWKYSVRAPGSARKPGSDIYVEDFLYDLKNDPHERMNLAGEPKWEGVRSKLAERLVDYMTRIGEKRPVIRKKA
jgi:arylsulfatase A-like enzyme